MTPARTAAIAGITAGTALLAWLLFVVLPSRYGTRPASNAAPVAAAGTETPHRTIKVRLFYVAEDGRRLTSVEQEVPFAGTPVDQAKAIVAAQLAPAAGPLVSAIPPGTALRALFLGPAGEAYVDLSREFTSAHPGGSMFELLTIYTLVEALTVNLPAITSVQLLVEGQEVDTLAGHVNLRRPLAKNLDWVN